MKSTARFLFALTLVMIVYTTGAFGALPPVEITAWQWLIPPAAAIQQMAAGSRQAFVEPATPTATSTATARPTVTPPSMPSPRPTTPVPTATTPPTASPLPSATPTASPSPTNTLLPTNTPVPTSTVTPLPARRIQPHHVQPRPRPPLFHRRAQRAPRLRHSRHQYLTHHRPHH